MCSYNAPNMLLPPIELISLGGILKEFSIIEYSLIDAIAESLTLSETISKINNISPHYIVTLQGFECFQEDMEVIDIIKENFQYTKIILFGYYSTLFPQEILENTRIDYIIIGEPDFIFKSLIKYIVNEIKIQDVKGIVYKNGNNITTQLGDLRINDIKDLPIPDYDLLNHNLYYEPFLGRPFGLLQSARGCPYTCNYCVKTYGTKLYYRTPEQIIYEIKYLKEKHGIKSIRFIDDTFTANKKRTIEICNQIIQHKLDITWSCLSRIDTITEDMIPIMKNAGCRRIYFGVESGSSKILKSLNKETDLTFFTNIVNTLKENRIDVYGLFIVGLPDENEIDYKQTIDYCLDTNFDFIAVSNITPYPGTEYFNIYRDSIDFSLFPYVNRWKNKDLIATNLAKEKYMYKAFYFRIKFAINSINLFIFNPKEYIINMFKLLLFIFKENSLKRKDYF